MNNLRALLDRHGYAVVPGLLPSEAIQTALSSIHATVGAQLRHLGLEAASGGNLVDLEVDLARLFDADLSRYKLALAAIWRRVEISSLLRHASLVGLLREELGWTDIFLPGGDVMVLVSDRLRIPGGYYGLEAHQDYLSVQGSLDGLVAWVPLTAVSATTFPMEVVAGSHRRGVLTDVEAAPGTGSRISPRALVEDTFTPALVAPGDVVLMSVFTVHRTRTVGCMGTRIALSTRFDNGLEPTFVARGFPTAYQRSVHREPLVAGFPTPAEVAAVRW